MTFKEQTEALIPALTSVEESTVLSFTLHLYTQTEVQLRPNLVFK